MDKKDKRAPTGDYPVGFAAPPEKYRYPKGKSGNPKGRPKKPKPDGVQTISNLLFEPLEVNSGGKTKKLLPQEIELQVIAKKALQDKDLKAIEHLLKKFAKYKLIPAPEELQGGGVVRLPDTEDTPFHLSLMLAEQAVKTPLTPAIIDQVRAEYKKIDAAYWERQRGHLREILRSKTK